MSITAARVDKGKARACDAEPTEDTPLLASTSGSLSSGDEHELSIQPPRRRLYTKLLTVFLISLSLCVLLFVLIAVVAYSYRSQVSQIPPEEILQRALVLRGPDRIDVLNASSSDGIWILVHGRIGLDAGCIVGVGRDEDDGLFKHWWKSLGRWGIRQLDRVTVDLSPIHVSPRAHPGVALATITTQPLEIPLTANPPRDYAWLTPVQVPVRIEPTKNASVLVHFVRESWKNGFVSVQATVAEAVVHGGALRDRGWRSRFVLSHTNVRPVVNIKIPTIPGLPPPGNDHSLPGFSDLVILQSFNIVSANETILIEANATAINPIPWDLEFSSPPLPFMISLPFPNATSKETPNVPVAFVHSRPFSLTHPNISLTVSGTVLPLERNASSALSAFVSEYISGHDADIQITTPLLPNLVINTTFPAPHPKPEILRNVSISDMKIKPVGTSMVASGTVHALVVLPHGINVGVNASRVFPDVLVFDGAVPGPGTNESESDVKGGPPPARPLPDPLPPRAFAHIRPDDWLPADCVSVEGPEDAGSTVSVSAHIVDVPLEVLPGREREFSNFVSKVIFGTQGALAGVQGEAAVAARVHGLPFANGRDGEMELTGLPFQGSVRIGKKLSTDGPGQL
ncbi:hypothetical protein BN946_scf184787.g5 [Trametes cinnabarina]|uniref:Uncharacterized protein n=1 Tax=Pycnoporus cinnabarinus TaxID=5643 RepID=A0A060STA8_PYCCI|nr:hypothetical protein BN946_scf184787.g5 [Trametes cinnabarina]